MEGGGLGLGYVDWQEKEDKMMMSSKQALTSTGACFSLLFTLLQASI